MLPKLLKNMYLQVGQIAPDFIIEDVLGKTIQLSKLESKKIFIAFLRNTRCPLCSHHVYKLSQKADELKKSGLEILVFYESKKVMFSSSTFFQENVFKDNKFSVISDTERKVYELYGAEVSPEKATLEALIAGGRMPEIEEASKAGFSGDGIEEGTNPEAIPADFLIDENLVIQYVHYGKDAGDNIDLRIVEKFAKS